MGTTNTDRELRGTEGTSGARRRKCSEFPPRRIVAPMSAVSASIRVYPRPKSVRLSPLVICGRRESVGRQRLSPADSRLPQIEFPRSRP